MPTTTQTPQQIVEDRKVAGLLDDLFDDCLDADKTARKIAAGTVFRVMDSKSCSSFEKDWDALLSAVDACESERDVCLKGKARDTRKLKSCLQAQLDALSVLEQANGKMQVLEDAATQAATTSALASITAVLGIAPKIAIVQKDLADLRGQLEKAILAARDAKVKTAVAAGSAAIGVCLVPFGAAVGVVGGITLFAVETAIGAAFNGNEESTVKKTWNAASGAAAVADGLYGLPAAFGPALVLVGGAVDIGECFATERDMADVQAKITALSREFKSTIAQAARDFETLGKMCAAAQKALLSAIAGVMAVRAPTAAGAAVMRFL